MMLSKFSKLLESGKTWKIVFDGIEYDVNSIRNIIINNWNSWSETIASLDDDGYILVVANNSFQYLVCILLSSCFNLKIIMAGSKQLLYFIESDFDFNIKCIISAKEYDIENVPNLHLTLDTRDHPVSNWGELVTDTDVQAEIMFCTSGTTSNFKIAKYRESRLYDNAEVVSEYMGLLEKDNCLCFFPTNYMYGFSVSMSMLIGGGRVFLERSTISAAMILEYLQNHNITLLPLIGSIASDLVKVINSKYYFDDLKVMNASDKIYESQVEDILSICPEFWNNMGQTESGPRIFTQRITNRDEIRDYSLNGVIALGNPVHEGIKISIRNEQGEECDLNEVGELYYNSVFSMDKYLNVENAMDQWYSSGDLVKKGSNGVVYWVGRKSQLVKVNGIFVNINLLASTF